MNNIRNHILAASDCRTKLVEVPEWGSKVYVSSVSADEREAWEEGIRTDNGVPQIRGARCQFLVKCLVDVNGDRIFGDDDAELLAGKSSLVIDRLWEVANEVNAVLGNGELVGN